jgi:co-chaperonin GroES (HSP10)
MKLQAANDFVFVVRDDTETETGGLIIPDSAQVQTNKGEIMSVGRLVRDRKTIQTGDKAIWNKHAGFTINYEGVDYTVLHEHEIIAIE